MNDDDFVPPAVAITSIEVPFWNIVTVVIKVLIALAIGAAIIAAVLWAVLAAVGTSLSAIADHF